MSSLPEKQADAASATVAKGGGATFQLQHATESRVVKGGACLLEQRAWLQRCGSISACDPWSCRKLCVSAPAEDVVFVHPLHGSYPGVRQHLHTTSTAVPCSNGLRAHAYPVAMCPSCSPHASLLLAMLPHPLQLLLTAVAAAAAATPQAMLYMVCDGHSGVKAAQFVCRKYHSKLAKLLPEAAPDFGTCCSSGERSMRASAGAA